MPWLSRPSLLPLAGRGRAAAAPRGAIRDAAPFCGQGLLLGKLLLLLGKGGWAAAVLPVPLSGVVEGGAAAGLPPPPGLCLLPPLGARAGAHKCFGSARTSAPAPVRARAAPAPLLECTVGHLPGPPQAAGQRC